MLLQLGTFLCAYTVLWLGGLLTTGEAATCNLQKSPLEVRIAGSILSRDKNSAYYRRGFELFEAAVNSEGPFAGRQPPFCLQDGRPIRVNVILEDTLEHDSVYSRMIANDTADLYLAPSWDEGLLSIARVARETETAKKILMKYNGAAPNLYTDYGLKYVFTTDAMANNYVEDALRILKAQGATTLAAAWENHTGEFNQAACHGGLEHAQHLGFDIKDTFVFDKVDLTRYIRATADLGPDVFLACGHLTDAINTVVTSRALGFSPKAMVITHSTTPVFIDAVGAPNANYLLAPVTWYESMEEGASCRVFGSAMEFAQSFAQMHKVQPTHHSASAAAAGIALLAAVEQIGAVGPADAIATALRSLDQQSFYGRLNFHSNGTLVNKNTFTQQVQRLPDDRSPEARYTESRIMLVSLAGGPEAPMWPMPTWEQKELEVFPCPPGQVVNQSNIQKVSCEPCGVGRYRPQSSLACTDCGVGFYSDVRGLAQCKLCPAGADCGPNKEPGVPLASPGYYKLPLAFTYTSCDPGSLCLGGNVCADKHRGVMCAQCENGFTLKQANFAGSNKVCADCPPDWRNIWLLVACFVVYSLYIGTLGYLTTASSSSVRAIHSIVLKKIVNHWQLATTAWAASEFDDYLDLQVVTDITQDPMRSFLSLDCLFRSHEVEEYKARTVIGLSIVPIVLLLNFVVFTVIMLLRLRIFLRDAKVNRHIRARDQAIANAREQNVEAHGESSAKDKHEDEDLEILSEASSNSSGSSHVPTTSLQVRWRALQETMVHSMQWGIVWIFILHPMVVKILLEGITCEEHDVMRLKANLDAICNTADHKLWFWLSLVGLAIYGLGIPLVNFWLLYRVRHRLMQLSIRRIYGFLYNGFESHWYYFEVVHMLRKVFILLVASIPVMYVRIVAMLCLSFAFLALHIFCNPYDNRDYFILDKLETTSLLALILTLQVRLFFNIRTEIQSSSPFVYEISMNEFFDYMMWGCCIGCHVYFWVLAFYSLFRNSVMKLWHLKAECAPDSLNIVQRFLLQLEPHMNRVRLDYNTHELDLSSLGQKERHFLYVALCDTMECYINTDRHFHPGRLLTAVHRAMDMCIRDRQWRAQQLLHLMQTRKKTKGFLGSTKHFLLQIRHAMMPGSAQRGKSEKSMSAAAKRREKRQRMRAISMMDHSATVEELQNALMMCWPEILEHRPRFFALKQSPQAQLASQQAMTGPVQSDAEAVGKVDPHANSASDEEVPIPKMDSNELAESVEKAAKPLHVSTVILRRRHEELMQEVWLLRSEVGALRSHLGAIEESEREFTAPAASERPLHAEAASSFSNENSYFERKDRIAHGVPVLSPEEATEKVMELVGKLRARKLEAEAVELRAMTARLLTMQRARVAALPADTTPANVELNATEQRQKDLEAKVVDALRKGEGWQELESLARRSSSVMHSVAKKLRSEGMDYDANVVEALSHRLCAGLITNKEVTEELQHLTTSWGAHAEAGTVEGDVMALIGCLRDLHLNEEADSIKEMATRLLSIDHLRHSTKGVRGRRRIKFRRDTDDVELRPSAVCEAVSKKVLAVLQKDTEWRLMAPVAANAVIDMGETSARLREKGFEEESDAVVAIIEELAESVTAEVPGVTASS